MKYSTISRANEGTAVLNPVGAIQLRPILAFEGLGAMGGWMRVAIRYASVDGPFARISLRRRTKNTDRRELGFYVMRGFVPSSLHARG